MGACISRNACQLCSAPVVRPIAVSGEGDERHIWISKPPASKRVQVRHCLFSSVPSIQARRSADSSAVLATVFVGAWMGRALLCRCRDQYKGDSGLVQDDNLKTSWQQRSAKYIRCSTATPERCHHVVQVKFKPFATLDPAFAAF